MRCTRLLTHVRRALSGRGAPASGESLVVALSGGPDSVALLDCLVEVSQGSGLRLVAAHLDHGLRPDSPDDAAFCAELCRRLGVPLESGRADLSALPPGEGPEGTARRARRAFLKGVARRHGARLVALGHTRDDQAETLLLSLLRGAGRTGLCAMRTLRGGQFRPLLKASRAEVLEHLAARGLSARHDSSNDDLRFRRNRVRHELLPLAEARLNGRARAALARTAALLADEEDLLEAQARRLLSMALEASAEGLTVRLGPLRQAPLGLLRRALRGALRRAGGLRGVSAVHLERLERLVLSRTPSGRRVELPGARVASFRFGRLHIGARPRAGRPFSLPLSVPGQVVLPDGRTLAALPGTGLDGAAPEALVVRTRRPGDRRAGERHSLKRLFTQARVPAELRDGWPVVAQGDAVVWVPGLDEATVPGVRLELRPASGEAR